MPRRVCLLLVSLAICAGTRISAGELTARHLADPKMAVLVEVHRPTQLAERALLRDLWQLFSQTQAVKRATDAGDFEKFRQVGRFLEKSLAVDWPTALARLTAGGIVVVVHPPQGPGEPEVTAVFTAADERTLTQFMSAIEAELRRAPETNNAAWPAPLKHHDHLLQRVGSSIYAVVGKQLVLTNSQTRLESALDRLDDLNAGSPRHPAFALPESLRLVDPQGERPTVLVTFNLQLLKQDPNLQRALQLPADEPMVPLLLGGYLDLLRRADFAAAGLFTENNAWTLRWRVAARESTAHPALRGFFAPGVSDRPAAAAASLLQPPGTIYSASWYRDYSRLWHARQDLLTPRIVRELESADENLRELPTQFGISDLLNWIGPQLRLVVARQREQVYRKKIEQRLPAVALVLSVRDETAIRDRVLAPADGLILFGLNKQIEGFQKLAHRDVRMTTFRFSDAAVGSDPSRQFLYHVNPAFVLTQGHLIIGSTAEIVRDLIDELKRESESTAAAPSSDTASTDRQLIALDEFVVYLQELAEQLVQDAVRNRGEQRDVVERDLQLLAQLLNRIASLQAEIQIAPEHVDFTVRGGPAQ
ncbi:MAG: hypothetical protein JSS02_03810 [Planctomycetes bacterium]|nr:hypothetical protein [Planctomycetota bacterium]